MSGRRKVLIVDDSPSVARFLTRILDDEGTLDVVGHALDPYEARDKIKALRPDVITLDVEMPRMDGLTFLRNLMRLRPMPVVMISSQTAAGATTTLDALEAGAVDFCVKRRPENERDLAEYTAAIAACVAEAANARVVAIPSTSPPPLDGASLDLVDLRAKLRRGGRPAPELGRLVTIGASTGGPEALRRVLSDLSPEGCAVLVSQHMPARFMPAFIARLNTHSALDVRAARHGERVREGVAYVSPGDRHLRLARVGGELRCHVDSAEPVNGYRPSVDVMFDSVARHAGAGAIGVLMTGMGEDGAAGLRRLRESGSLAIAQDRDSSTVWGMPGRAVAIGGVDRQLDLDRIGPAINALVRDADRTSPAAPGPIGAAPTGW